MTLFFTIIKIFFTSNLKTNLNFNFNTNPMAESNPILNLFQNGNLPGAQDKTDASVFASNPRNADAHDIIPDASNLNDVESQPGKTFSGVTTTTLNPASDYLIYWDGNDFAASGIYYDGVKYGINTTTPSEMLHLNNGRMRSKAMVFDENTETLPHQITYNNERFYGTDLTATARAFMYRDFADYKVLWESFTNAQKTDLQFDFDYLETGVWYDGSAMTDERVDDNIFIKKDNKYFQKTISGDILIKIGTVSELRQTNAYYEGQEALLLGYHVSGDKSPVVYKFTVADYSTLLDDGGAIIKTSKGSWIAQFNDKINALDFGIKPDYNPTTQTGTDNSQQIQNMFAVPSQIYEFPEGDILMNTHLKVPNGVLIKGKGAYKTRIYRGSSTGTSTGVLYQLSASNDEIVQGTIWMDMAFYGQVTTTNHNQWTHLLSIAGTKNAKIIRCHFWGFRGDGILISSGPGNTDRRRNINPLIRDCYFNGQVLNNRNGISVIMTDNITIENNYFENIGAPTLSQSVGAIDVERNSITDQVTGNITIINNTFKDIVTTNTAGVALFCFGDNTAAGIPSSKSHDISGNHFINCYWGISTPESKLDKSAFVTPTSINITGNFFVQNVKAIQIMENSNVNITDNHFYGDYANGKYCNIEFWATYVAKDIKIKGNHFYKTGRNASIDITSADGLYIHDNVCKSNRPFIQFSVDSVSGDTSRVLNSIKIFRNSFESLVTSGTALRMIQIASGANNARLLMNNSSCEVYDNEVKGNAVLSNITTSVFNKMVFDTHITQTMMTGTWRAGDFVEAKLNNYNYRIKCAVSGTTTFTDTPFTASATNGSNVLTVTSAISTQLRKGSFILVGDDTAVKEVVDLYGDTVVLKANYTGATNPVAAVTAFPPQFISEPLTNYVRSTTTNTNLNIGKGKETIIFTGGGAGASIITADNNGFANAFKTYKNNKTDDLTITANTGVTLDGQTPGAVVVKPGKTLTIMSTGANTWVTLYSN